MFFIPITVIHISSISFGVFLTVLILCPWHTFLCWLLPLSPREPQHFDDSHSKLISWVVPKVPALSETGSNFLCLLDVYYLLLWSEFFSVESGMKGTDLNRIIISGMMFTLHAES